MDFEFKSDLTFDEYKQYNRVIATRVLHQPLIIGIISLVVFGQALYYYLTKGFDFLLKILPLDIFYVIAIAFILIKARNNIKKTWESKAIARGAVITYHFYPDRIEVSGMDSEGRYTYDRVRRLLETDTHIYLMLQNNLGYIIRKSLLTSEQMDFIREKCKGGKNHRNSAQQEAVTVTAGGDEPEPEPQEGEEPLYTAETVYTLKEYYRYSFSMLARVQRFYLVPAAVLAFVMLYFLVEFGINGLLYFIRFAFPYLLALFGLIFLLRLLAVYLSWKRNPYGQNIKNHYRFYNDRFTVKGSSGRSSIPYDKIYRIIETRTDFYLMIAKNQGFILSKQDCSDELKSFLKMRSKKN
ncbi:MAG: YcxB family protein [Lachnospiraceae bacterium]|nr:YcxB family protein [Lachnospiraceae bacterium]